MPKPSTASRPAPAAPAATPDPQARLEEDQHQLARWRDELEARLEERLAHQARQRDQLDDALDHLEGVRQSIRDRTADLAAPAPSGLNPACSRHPMSSAVHLEIRRSVREARPSPGALEIEYLRLSSPQLPEAG